MDPLKIKLLELDAKIVQLNKDLASLAQQIGELAQRFNTETNGHGVDVSLNCDWHKSVEYAEPFGPVGVWLLARIALNAKHMDLPRERYV